MPRGLEAKADFQRFQFQFTSHIRNPKKNPRPEGIPSRRMAVYNDLLFNNIEGVLAACFPVLKLILKGMRWTELVRDFFSEHECRRPFFREVPEEFMEYLKKERRPRKTDPCFLRSLAHYEWIELSLFVAEEGEGKKANQQGDLLNEKPVFNPVLKVVSYPYLVHRLSPEYQPKRPEKEWSHYLAFRNRNDEVEFMKLNSLSARLVNLLLKGSLTGRKALEKISKEESKTTSPQSVIEGGLKILEEFREKGAILGTQPLPLSLEGKG